MEMLDLRDSVETAVFLVAKVVWAQWVSTECMAKMG